MSIRLAVGALVVSLCGAAPVLADTGTAVPEPSSLVLFGLGVAGVIIGRKGGYSRRK
jgi:hypothetical protein